MHIRRLLVLVSMAAIIAIPFGGFPTMAENASQKVISVSCVAAPGVQTQHDAALCQALAKRLMAEDPPWQVHRPDGAGSGEATGEAAMTLVVLNEGKSELKAKLSWTIEGKTTESAEYSFAVSDAKLGAPGFDRFIDIILYHSGWPNSY